MLRFKDTLQAAAKPGRLRPPETQSCVVEASLLPPTSGSSVAEGVPAAAEASSTLDGGKARVQAAPPREGGAEEPAAAGEVLEVIEARGGEVSGEVSAAHANVQDALMLEAQQEAKKLEQLDNCKQELQKLTLGASAEFNMHLQQLQMRARQAQLMCNVQLMSQLMAQHQVVKQQRDLRVVGSTQAMRALLLQQSEAQQKLTRLLSQAVVLSHVGADGAPLTAVPLRMSVADFRELRQREQSSTAPATAATPAITPAITPAASTAPAVPGVPSSAPAVEPVVGTEQAAQAPPHAARGLPPAPPHAATWGSMWGLPPPGHVGPPALPLGWVEAQDPRHDNATYYFHTRTKEASWTRPEETLPPPTSRQRNDASTGTVRLQLPSSTHPGAKMEPQGEPWSKPVGGAMQQGELASGAGARSLSQEEEGAPRVEGARQGGTAEEGVVTSGLEARLEEARRGQARAEAEAARLRAQLARRAREGESGFVARLMALRQHIEVS